MSSSLEEIEEVGHLRFTFLGEKLAMGPWNLSMLKSLETEMDFKRIADVLRIVAAKVEQHGFANIEAPKSKIPAGLHYTKLHLYGDEPIPACKPMSREHLANHLEKAARQSLSYDWSMSVVTFNLIVSLCDDLFNRAMHSDEYAQRALKWSAENIVNNFINAAWRKAPGIVEECEKSAWIPGNVSLFPEVAPPMQEMCERVNQGANYPRKRSKKGKQETLSTPQNHLVDRLFKYMDSYRHNASILEIGTFQDCFEALDPLIKKLVKLPPFSVTSVSKWHKLGIEVIWNATNQNPFDHPAFATDGDFAGLAGVKDGTATMIAKLLTAWKTRAQNLAREGLPPA